MELFQARINFLGDSITEGVGASDPSLCYVARIEREYGAVCRNYGISGTRIAVQTTPSQWPGTDRDFLSRVEGMDPDADAVFVFGGTNDYGHGDAPLGTMDDREGTTFYGAMHTLCRRLLARYDAGRIVIATPLHRLNEDDPYGDVHKKTPGAPLRAYVAAIREVAAYYALPVLDLYATSGIQPEVPFLRERYTTDGLHPNDAGHALLARKIALFLEHSI